jgi:hypothetical protein
MTKVLMLASSSHTLVYDTMCCMTYLQPCLIAEAVCLGEVLWLDPVAHDELA